jgi:hypothetical protein
MERVGFPWDRGEVEAHRRSLRSAAPDFLWKLVALANIMRLSLKKGARTALSSIAWQENPGTLRSG